MNRPVLVTPPAILPVSLAEAKLHLRVEPDVTLEDTLITGLIGAATSYLDGWTGILGRCLVEQTIRQDFDGFASCLPLPLGPVIEIVSVTVGGNLVDASDYAVLTDAGGRSRVEIAHIASGPGPVSVTYKAGYATIPEVPEVPAVEPGPGDPPDPPGSPAVPAIPAQSTVPEAIKIAIKLFVGAWFENREETAIGVSVAGLPDSVAAHSILAPWRKVGV